MKVKLLIPALLAATQLHASLIDLGPDRLSYIEGFAFNELNGQSTKHVSFDLLFNTSVHAFRNTSPNFEVGLDFLTSTQGSPNFLTGTGTLLDANGNAICAPRPLASFVVDNGIVSVGMYPFYVDKTGKLATDIDRPLDFYGVHFDLNLPSDTIVAGDFYISTPNYAGRFRIGPHVPVITVRYEAVNAMLLNEFLKEHRKVEEQAGEIAQMKKQIESLSATVQKVSDQIALSKPAPQLVANP